MTTLPHRSARRHHHARSCRQTVRVTHAGTGRHRAPKRASRLPLLAVVSVVGVVLIAGGIAVMALQDPDQGSPIAVNSKAATPAAPATSRLEVRRVVEVRGNKVTVRQTTSLVSGDTVVVVPATASLPAGLKAARALVVDQTGTNTSFKTPIELTLGNELTVDGHYELSDCPDVLPTRWPSPTSVVPGNWQRTLVWSQSPQRTARGVCPDEKSRAERIEGLDAKVVPGQAVAVRVRWQGPGQLTLHSIGSASGVAATTPFRQCKGACAARLPSRSTSALAFQPLEPCPVGTRSNVLTLVVSPPSEKVRVARLVVPGLHRQVCSASFDSS